jgi:hypothetical protein
MTARLNDALTKEILKAIPKNTKLVEYLTEILAISRESAYRRIRSEIPYTLEEAILLSTDLKFSIDELISQTTEDLAIFEIQSPEIKSPSDSFLRIIKQYCLDILSHEKSENRECTIIANRFPEIFMAKFNSLFKFSYYKWLHQTCETPLKLRFDEISLTDEIIEVQKKIKTSIPTCDNNIFIVDSHLVSNMVKEIQYYYRRNLINDDDLYSLIKDLHDCINMVEEVALTGRGKTGAKYELYLSSVNIESNSSQIKFNDKEISRFYVYSHNSIKTSNKNVCETHKRNIEALRKGATLISQSNEALRAKYFEQQHAETDRLIKSVLII